MNGPSSVESLRMTVMTFAVTSIAAMLTAVGGLVSISAMRVS